MFAIIRFIAKIITLPILVVSVAGLMLTLGLAYLFCVTTLKILGSWVWKKKRGTPSAFLNMVGGEATSFDSEIRDMLNSVKKNTMGR